MDLMMARFSEGAKGCQHIKMTHFRLSESSAESGRGVKVIRLKLKRHLSVGAEQPCRCSPHTNSWGIHETDHHRSSKSMLGWDTHCLFLFLAVTSLIHIVKHLESSAQGCYFREKPLPTNAWFNIFRAEVIWWILGFKSDWYCWLLINRICSDNSSKCHCLFNETSHLKWSEFQQDAWNRIKSDKQ